MAGIGPSGSLKTPLPVRPSGGFRPSRLAPISLAAVAVLSAAFSSRFLPALSAEPWVETGFGAGLILFAVSSTLLIGWARRLGDKPGALPPNQPRLDADLKRINRLYSALSRVNQAVVHALSRSEMFDVVCRALVEGGGFRMAWIGCADLQTHELTPVAQCGDDQDYLGKIVIYTDNRTLGLGPAGRAFKTGQPYVCNDFFEDPCTLPWQAQAQRMSIHAVVVVPIRQQGEIMGTLAVYASEPGVFQEKEVSLLVEVAADLSFALDNFVRQEEGRAAESTIRRLAAIVADSDDAIIGTTLEGIITDWNPAAERLFGYLASEIIGKPLRTLVPPERAGEELAVLRRIGIGENVRHFETVRVKKSGEPVAVSVTYSAIRQSPGTGAEASTIVGASKIVRNITERKELEARAHRERAFLDALIEGMPGIIYLSSEQGQVLRWNQNFARLSGYRPDEIAAMRPLEFFAETDQRIIGQAIAEVLQTGDAFAEADFLSRDGSRTPFYFSIRRLMFDGKRCVAGMGVDITALKRAEDRLRHSEERYRSTLDHIQDGCLLISFKWLCLYLNEAAIRTFRLSRPDPAGVELSCVWPAVVNHPAFDFMQSAMDKRIPIDQEIRFPTAPGEHAWFNLRIQPVPEGIFAIFIDISERKQAKQDLEHYALRLQAASRRLLEVQESERRALARELHDSVGQELTAISLNLSMIRCALPDPLSESVSAQFDDAQRSLEITSRHLRGVMNELRPPGLDDLGLVAALRDHIHRLQHHSSIDYVLSGPDSLPPLSPSVAIALFRIVQEALHNTLKHARATCVTIDVSHDFMLLRIIITDDGCGFDASRKPLIGAGGMGMTTMRERAEAIGARLHFASQIGQGTTITVELPETAPVEPVPSISPCEQIR